jgi:CrcB protein
MQKIILIGLAGLVGTLCRYWLSGIVARQYGETFPWGTLVVNVVGCFLAGSLFYLMEERFLVSPTLRSVILIGLLGGFTTFSFVRFANFYVVARRGIRTCRFERHSFQLPRLADAVGGIQFG